MRQRRKGFSLMELMIVVAIILLIGAISAPNIVETIRRYQMEASAREVHNMLLRARYDAIRFNRNITTLYEAPAAADAPARYGLDFNNNGVLDVNEPRAQLSVRITLIAAAPAGVNVSLMQVVDPAASPVVNTGYWTPQMPAPPAYSITVTPRGTPLMTVPGSTHYLFLMQNQVYKSNVRALTMTSQGKVRSWRWDGDSWVQ